METGPLQLKKVTCLLRVLRQSNAVRLKTNGKLGLQVTDMLLSLCLQNHRIPFCLRVIAKIFIVRQQHRLQRPYLLSMFVELLSYLSKLTSQHFRLQRLVPSCVGWCVSAFGCKICEIQAICISLSWDSNSFKPYCKRGSLLYKTQ